MRPKIETRWATPEDASRLAELATAVGFEAEDVTMDWSRAAPYWIVATLDDVVVAAIQVLAAFPIGRIDFLLVNPDLGAKERAETVKKITAQATHLLHVAGCQIAASYITGVREDDYLKVAQRHGWVIRNEVFCLWKRIH